MRYARAMSSLGAPGGQARAATLSTLCGMAIMAQHVGGKALRDGLFLTQFAVDALPKAMLASAILAIPAVLGVSFGMTRFGPDKVAPAMLVLSAALFGAEWALLPLHPHAIAGFVYLHVATLGGTVISAFWSLLSERFDPHSAKHALARVTNGVALGGLFGGLLVSHAAKTVDSRSLLLAIGAINLVSALGVARIGRAPYAASAAGESFALASPITVLRGSKYLRALALLVLLTGFVSALLDFSFKAEALASLGSGPQLVQLFALFHTATAVVTALVQTTLARRALERLGLAGTLAVLPSTVLLTGALGVSVPMLWSNALLRGASSVLESSLFRSAYEPLYTPLPADVRRSSKTIIDVGVGRLGEALGSGSALLLVSFVLVHASSAVILVAMAGAALALLISLRLHDGYVAALTQSLRSGAVSLRESDVIDSTTRLTLSQTQTELNRGELLAQLAALRANFPQPVAIAPRAPGTTLPGAEPARNAHPAGAARLQAPDNLQLGRSQLAHGQEPVLEAARDLLSGEPARIHALLAKGPLDRRLVALVIPLLQQRELALPVTSALSRIASSIVGQLVDTLLDPQQPVLLRQRLPRVIKSCDDERAVHGLMHALRGAEPGVRRRAALALAELTAKKPELRPERGVVFEVVREELRHAADQALDLRHIFSILALAAPGEGLALAREALASDDLRQRGTALEYLQNVLPEPLRSELIARLT
jgi:ATP:ADP antiporter, AAA family